MCGAFSTSPGSWLSALLQWQGPWPPLLLPPTGPPLPLTCGAPRASSLAKCLNGPFWEDGPPNAGGTEDPLEGPWVEGDELRDVDLLFTSIVPPCQPHKAKACPTGGSALLGPWPSTPELSLLPRGPQVLSHTGLFPSCFWHFYLLRPKALGSSDLRMSSCVHKGRGKRRGPGSTVCPSPPNPPSLWPRKAGQ